ncbi:MAG: hypothetical protein H7263_18970 [Candidatus Sericytochromatia bacterium]|nr:hypothetical protein [Candidatus Sericytochromatia bacterium]
MTNELLESEIEDLGDTELSEEENLLAVKMIEEADKEIEDINLFSKIIQNMA